MVVANKKVVSINYNLKNEKGELIDSSNERGPLSYIHGIGNIIPGLEKELTGKKVNDPFNVKVEPQAGYGEFNKELVREVSKDYFKNFKNLEVGMEFELESKGGIQLVVVTNITNDKVTIDGNHPLAGETLFFDGVIVDIRDSTKEELSHGHVHHPGHEHH